MNMRQTHGTNEATKSRCVCVCNTEYIIKVNINICVSLFSIIEIKQLFEAFEVNKFEICARAAF